MTSLKEELSFQEMPTDWHWNRDLLVKTRDKAQELILKVNDAPIKNILIVILKNLNEVLYTNSSFDKNAEKISQINKGVKLLKEKTMSIDETARKLEAEQKPRQSAIKKIVTAGLIMFSLGLYHPTNVNAQDVGAGAENGKTGAYVTPGGSVGSNVVLPGGGSVGVTPDGRPVVVPRNNKTKYNYSSAQQYITQANEAYKKHKYADIIDLSEEALFRIQQGQLKATPKEVDFLKQAKDVGYSNIK